MGRGTSLDIAIVGCGISGMAAGTLLARAGHRVRLFERFAAPAAVGAGLLLQPGGLAVLRHLGLADRISRDGARIDRLEGRAHPSKRHILRVAYADLDPGLHGIGIHRASLFAALHGALEASDCTVIPATTVAAIGHDANARPRLIDEAGRLHGPFDLAIDASGAQSRLRPARGQRAPAPFPYGALWTTVPLAGTAFDAATLAQRYARARQMIGVMPVGSMPGADGPHAAFFWSLRRDGLDAWRRAGIAAWKDDVAGIWPEAAELLAGIDRTEQMQPAFYVHYTARRPVGPRRAAIGDAAHATSPQLGQGANMGLLDAWFLAEALGRDAPLDAALAAYQAARRGHVRFYQRASWWLTPLFQSESRVAAGLRDLGFPLAHSLPLARRDIVRGLAGLKTGLFASFADELAGIGRDGRDEREESTRRG